MQSDIIQTQPDRGFDAPELSISSVYGDLTFEQAAEALERCGIAFWTEITDVTGTCIVFKEPSIGSHFELRWRGPVKFSCSWEHPDLGLGFELEHQLPPEALDWLDEEYRGAFRFLPRTALIFANELHRTRFAEALAADKGCGV